LAKLADDQLGQVREEKEAGVIRAVVNFRDVLNSNRHGDGTGFRVDNSYIAAQVVERSGFVRDSQRADAAGDPVGILLAFQNFEHLPGTREFAILYQFEEADHFPRGGAAEAPPFVLFEEARFREALRGSEVVAIAADLAHELGVGQRERLQAAVDGFGRDALDQHVGGGVIADDDHEIGDVAEFEFGAGGEFAQYAASGDGVGGAEGEFFVELPLAFGGTGVDLAEQGEFDGAGGADFGVALEVDGLAGGQIAGGEEDFARALGGSGGEEFFQIGGGQHSGEGGE
jgi:hypothetical protein